MTVLDEDPQIKFGSTGELILVYDGQSRKKPLSKKTHAYNH
jgi:hypothetical protein